MGKKRASSTVDPASKRISNSPHSTKTSSSLATTSPIELQPSESESFRTPRKVASVPENQRNNDFFFKFPAVIQYTPYISRQIICEQEA